MNYLVEGAMSKIKEELDVLDEALSILTKNGFNKDSVAVQVLSEKRDRLNLEYNDLVSLVS